MRLAVVIAVSLLVAPVGAAQRPRAVPPVDTAGAGGFSARKLARPVAIDGRNWIETARPAVPAAEGQPFRPAGADFQLRFIDPDEEGDFERWALMFERPGSRPVSLTAGGKTGFAYVTPDARFIFMEPLIVVDVQRWRRYALYQALGISSYVDIVAISGDRRRLFIRRSDCALDCGGERVEYFELTLPAR